MCSCPITGTASCHCAGCHETFTGIRSFDRHQRLRGGGIECLDPRTAQTPEGRQIFTRASRSGHWQEYRPGQVNPWA